MKIAPLMKALADYPEVDPILIHTGQHYDDNMSGQVFRDLGIPQPQFHLEVLAPRGCENLRVIDRQLIGHRRRVLPADVLDRVQRVAVHPVFLGIRVIVVVQTPALEIGGIDDQRVAFPVPDGVSIEAGLQSLPVRAPIQRNDAGHALKFMHDYQVVLILRHVDRVRG